MSGYAQTQAAAYCPDLPRLIEAQDPSCQVIGSVIVLEVGNQNQKEQPHPVLGLLQMVGIAKEAAGPRLRTDIFRYCAWVLTLKRRRYLLKVETLRLAVGLHCARNGPGGLMFVAGRRVLQPQRGR